MIKRVQGRMSDACVMQIGIDGKLKGEIVFSAESVARLVLSEIEAKPAGRNSWTWSNNQGTLLIILVMRTEMLYGHDWESASVKTYFEDALSRHAN